MTRPFNRRDFLKLAGMGGVVFASGLSGWAKTLATGTPATGQPDEFYFVQLSDTHWGFADPAINPDARGTLHKAIATVNRLDHPPDFIVFTGDLTHTTDDPGERRSRLAQFRDIISKLKVKDLKLLPGEHDAALDHGEAYQEVLGPTHYTFDHRGVHFIVLDNVSDPAASLGNDQLAWRAANLAPLDKDAPVVVFTHRPLFELYPRWDWTPRDGAQALELLRPYRHVTVFYGHIHQEHHFQTGSIVHHAAQSLIFPLPAPGSVPQRAPLPWDPAAPYRGLGGREVTADPQPAQYSLTEFPVLTIG